MRYRVLGDIAYEAEPASVSGTKPVFATAFKGDIVALNSRDAAALLARGDVVEHDLIVSVGAPPQGLREPRLLK
jgi:hypothetical protein